uniref:Uncharacterized protein n=1 Tax=Oryza barthii TaxID=65489 RepID=A0A0D3FD95_9ORYZ
MRPIAYCRILVVILDLTAAALSPGNPRSHRRRRPSLPPSNPRSHNTALRVAASEPRESSKPSFLSRNVSCGFHRRFEGMIGSKFHTRVSIDAQSSPINMKQGTLANGSAFCSEKYSPAGLFLKNLKCGSNFTDGEQQDGANGHVKLESLEGMRDDGYFIPPYFIGGQQENEHDLSRLCPTIGEEDSDDIPNKVTMSLDGKPADVASSFDLCMTQLKLYMCLMYASVDISEQVGYEKILAVATPRPASFYFSMKYLNKCITAVIDPFTGWLLAIITCNYAAQFRRSDFPYVRLANTVLMKAEGKYNGLAPDGNLSIPIGIGHLREAVITLADFDGIETPESLFSMAVLVHHIMEPAKIHKAYSLVYKTLSEGTETTYSLSDPSIVQLTKNLGHVSSLAGRSLFDLFLGLPVRTIPPSKFKVEGISTIHDVFSEICLIPYSLIPKWYICSKTPPMFWCPVSPGLGDPDTRPLENFPAALQTTDGERMLDLLRIELFFGDRTGVHPCAKAFEVVRRRPPGEDASYVWRLGPPIRGRLLCDAVSLKPAVDAVLRSKGKDPFISMYSFLGGQLDWGQTLLNLYNVTFTRMFTVAKVKKEGWGVIKLTLHGENLNEWNKIKHICDGVRLERVMWTGSSGT